VYTAGSSWLWNVSARVPTTSWHVPTANILTTPVPWNREVREFISVVFINFRTKRLFLQTVHVNWLVFITERESVYCAVRTGSLYVITVFPYQYDSAYAPYHHHVAASSRQTGEAWEPFTSNALSKIGEHWTHKILPLFRLQQPTCTVHTLAITVNSADAVSP
jgi:hypothetical protein